MASQSDRADLNLRQLAGAVDELAFHVRALASDRSTIEDVAQSVDILAKMANSAAMYSTPIRNKRLRVAGAAIGFAEPELSGQHVRRAARIARHVEMQIVAGSVALRSRERLLIVLERLAAAIQETDTMRLRNLKLRHGFASETLRS